MYVSINKLTNKMIGSQCAMEIHRGGGETHPDTKTDDVAYATQNLEILRQNAINQGYLEKDIEVKFVTPEEYEALMKASKPVPTSEELSEQAIKAKMAEISDRELRVKAIAEIEAENVAEKK